MTTVNIGTTEDGSLLRWDTEESCHLAVLGEDKRKVSRLFNAVLDRLRENPAADIRVFDGNEIDLEPVVSSLLDEVELRDATDEPLFLIFRNLDRALYEGDSQFSRDFFDLVVKAQFKHTNIVYHYSAYEFNRGVGPLKATPARVVLDDLNETNWELFLFNKGEELPSNGTVDDETGFIAGLHRNTGKFNLI